MSVHCFYHKIDWDGFASAAIVKMEHPDVILHPFNYDCEFPIEKIGSDDTVYFVDVSIQPIQKMFAVCEVAKKVIWIDHHKSVIDDLNVHTVIPHNLECVLDASYAACELTYMHFNFERDIPPSIKLLGQYDSWRDSPAKMKCFDTNWRDVLAFQFGMRINPLNVEWFINSVLNAEPSPLYVVDRIIEQGRIILKYQDQQNETAMKSSFNATVDDMRLLCLNTGHRNSQVFQSKWNEADYDMMLAFSFMGKKWSYSVYSTKPDIDCSAFAKRYGGGGHKGAAGFYSDSLIFNATGVDDE